MNNALHLLGISLALGDVAAAKVNVTQAGGSCHAQGASFMNCILPNPLNRIRILFSSLSIPALQRQPSSTSR